MKLLPYLRRPVRFDYLSKFLKRMPALRILDVGCGNNSATLTKAYYPRSVYHGIERSKDLLSVEDLEAIDQLFVLDLDKDDLREIENECYDCIIASHVIEHLRDGLGLIGSLVTKLKHDGILYVETPTPTSVRFPRMSGTLNFYDDPTHVRPYSRHEVCSVLTDRNCEIVWAGTRRSLKRIALFPAHIAYSLWRYGELRGTVFWDLLGFASIVIARKHERV